MMNRMRLTVGAVLLATAAAACSGSNLFTGSSGSSGGGNQSQAGSVQGSVTAGGAAVGGVRVIVIGQDSATTTTTGQYVISNLPPATYSVAVRVPLNYDLAPGQTGTRTVTVAASSPTTVNFQLQERTTTTF